MEILFLSFTKIEETKCVSGPIPSPTFYSDFYNVLSYIWCKYAFISPLFQSILGSVYPYILDEFKFH